MASDVTIALSRGSPAEAATRRALYALLARHDVEPWLYSREILVEEGCTPHSHPVLTLGTANRGDPDMLLAELVHEELHWFEDRQAEARERAIAHSHAHYPQVPCVPPEGAQDEHSTRLHLFVCHWEHQVLQRLIGDQAARRVIEALSRHHYRWVYRTVLRDAGLLEALSQSASFVPRALKDAIP